MLRLTTKQRAVVALESKMIQHLRGNEGTSRVELARAMELAPSTIGTYVDRLIEKGLLLEGEKSKPSSGRPPIVLQLNSKAGQFIGIDFDARQLSATSIDFSQQTLRQHKQRIRESDTPESVIKKIKTAVAAVTSSAKCVLGIGVAVPGTIDQERGIALHYGLIRNWRNVELVERLSRELGLPVYLENNIRVMALAERWFGHARGIDNFLCLGIRSGIGAGVVINGQLYQGHSNLAGEIGGWRCLDANAKRLPGTLEQIASTRAILEQLTEAVLSGKKTLLQTARPGKVTLDDMLKAAAENDPLVLRILHRTGRVLGGAVSQMSQLLNPELVVVAGPLAQLEAQFLDPMRESLESSSSLHSKLPQIVASQLGEYGGAYGAAAMAVHQWKPTR